MERGRVALSFLGGGRGPREDLFAVGDEVNCFTPAEKGKLDLYSAGKEGDGAHPLPKKSRAYSTSPGRRSERERDPTSRLTVRRARQPLSKKGEGERYDLKLTRHF